MTKQETDKPNVFDGDRAAAERRLRDLVELVIQRLATQELNCIAYRLAASLTIDPASRHNYAEEMSCELKEERRARSRAPLSGPWLIRKELVSR